jgi:uncharacterized protein YcbK (DUF882 family)
MNDGGLSRRRLIGGALGFGAAALLGGGQALAALPERRLALRSVHNGERYDACYFRNGQYDPTGLAEINHALRDWRTGDAYAMDRELIDLLADLRDRIGADPRKPYDLISGYRSPRTNSALRARGGEHTGVATKSQHLLGKASDIALPGIPLSTVKTAALSLQRGGVGFYPRDGFVHVDTGRVRTW